MASNFWGKWPWIFDPSLCTGIAGMNHHAWFYVVLRMEAKISFIPSRHSTDLVTTPFHKICLFNRTYSCFLSAFPYATFISFIESFWLFMFHIITLIWGIDGNMFFLTGIVYLLTKLYDTISLKQGNHAYEIGKKQSMQKHTAYDY